MSHVMLSSTHIQLPHASVITVLEKIRSVLDSYAGTVDYTLDPSRRVYMCKQLTPRGFLREDFVHIMEDEECETVTVEVRRIFGDGLLFERDKDVIDIWASVHKALSNVSGTTPSRSQLFESRADWFTSMSRGSDDSLDGGEDGLSRRVGRDDGEDAMDCASIDLPLIEHLVYSPSEETKWEGMQLLCTALFELLDKIKVDPSQQQAVATVFERCRPRIMKMLEEVFVPTDFLPLLDEDISVLREAVENSTPLPQDRVCSRRGEFLTTRMSRAADMKELRFYLTPAMEVSYVVLGHICQLIDQCSGRAFTIDEAQWLPRYLESTCLWIDLNGRLFPELSYGHAAVLRAVQLSLSCISNPPEK